MTQTNRSSYNHRMEHHLLRATMSPGHSLENLPDVPAPEQDPPPCQVVQLDCAQGKARMIEDQVEQAER